MIEEMIIFAQALWKNGKEQRK